MGSRVGDDVTRGLLEDPDELPADDLALRLGVGHARKGVEEAVDGVDDDELDARGSDEVPLDLLGLARTQQAVVDEDARELLADGALHERGRDGRVDAARQPADDAAVPDLVADELDLLGDDVAGRPVGREARTGVEEVLERALTERRVPDLGVPLHSVEAPLAVLEGRDGSTGRAREHVEPGGRSGDGDAMAHPHALLGGRAGEQVTRAVDLDTRVAVLALRCGIDLCAERVRHRLEAVADTEHGHAGVEQRCVDRRSALLEDARRATREDHCSGVLREHLLDGPRVRHDLGVHASLAHAARDELGVLRAVVDDEDGAVGDCGHGG